MTHLDDRAAVATVIDTLHFAMHTTLPPTYPLTSLLGFPPLATLARRLHSHNSKLQPLTF